MKINLDEDRNRRVPSCMYSPLETNRQNSQFENGQIMASARDGTPIASNKAADERLISEFDPLESTAKKQEDVSPNNVMGFTTQTVPCSLKNNYVQDGQEPGMTVGLASPKCKINSLTGKKLSTGNLQ